jgi:AcrR family transcriptional regulator
VSATKRVGRPAKLSRDAICEATSELVNDTGAAAFSMRALGEKLGVDPTAVYRHFADRDDLLREVGDRALTPVVDGFVPTSDPRKDIMALCIRLRTTLIANPIGLQITAQGPTRRPNELQITEIILSSLDRAGLAVPEAVVAYHTIIEHTLGSAWLDAPLAQAGETRFETYHAWRSDYLELDAQSYPATRAAAGELYPASEMVFESGLDALISGLVPN